MIKEIKIAIKKGQTVSIFTKNDETLTGIPENTSMNGKIKLRNERGVIYIPYEDLVHVTRIIAFP